MIRRLFLGQISAGLTLYGLSASPAAGFVVLPQSTNQSASALTDRAAEWVRAGFLGTPQRLTLSHIYSPNQTSLTALLTRAHQDFGLASRLLGIDLSMNGQTLLTDSPSAAFGSYSARFDRDDMLVIWQGLARIGRRPNAPTGTLRLFGSEGILQTDTDRLTYQLVDLQGRVVRAENQAGSTGNRFTRRGFFSTL